ncbi:terminal nucleotidyltransferase 4A isoform X2 [Rosa chinensis]|uniref:terminal nucleotidyltransferase 4A isoform X2 n=1 Tax=Rosa chinensis TaxID=74649 RepID=UPI000D0927B2|nr:terminal nucleotidyltransferase 4A isoform X2 [Rosa chinensis]
MYLRIASGLLVPEAKLFLHSEDLLYVDKAKPHDRRTMCDSPIVQTKLSNHLQVKDLTEQFPAATPLALALKQFLADCSLDQSYSGGLSSYCLVPLIVRFPQHECLLDRPINQEFGDLLMNFLYFFGNVFDPRQMRISVQGSGVHIKRERGCRFFTTGLPSDVVVEVGEMSFHLHNFLLLSRSRVMES